MNREDVDTLIDRRCGALLRQCGLALVPSGGDNVDLSDPIAWALRQCGVSVASPVAPTEDEIASIGASLTDKFLDHTELRALESALTRYLGVDESSEGQSQRHNQLAARIERAITRKREQIARDYGTSAATLTAGAISLSFQETFDAS